MSKQIMSEQNSKEQVLYQQNCESFRHFNRLKWSRFQIVMAVEAGMILAIYKFNLSQEAKILFIIAGSIIIILACILSFLDRRDENFFWERIRKYHGDTSEKDLQGITLGFIIIAIAMGLVFLFNVVLLILNLKPLLIRWLSLFFN